MHHPQPIITADEFISSNRLSKASVIFGGTFDPIHEGHIQDVRFLTRHAARVFIAPTAQNPWKEESATPLHHRLNMIRLVLAQEQMTFSEDVHTPGLILLDYAYTYATDLVENLRSNLTGDIIWAIGEDLVQSAPNWRDWNEKGVPLLVLPLLEGKSGTAVRTHSQEPHAAIVEYIREHSLY